MVYTTKIKYHVIATEYAIELSSIWEGATAKHTLKCYCNNVLDTKSTDEGVVVGNLTFYNDSWETSSDQLLAILDSNNNPVIPYDAKKLAMDLDFEDRIIKAQEACDKHYNTQVKGTDRAAHHVLAIHRAMLNYATTVHTDIKMFND